MYQGIVSYAFLAMGFLQEVFAHLFDLGWFANPIFGETTSGALPLPSVGQTTLLITNLPSLTPKGEDIVAGIMTMVHNGIVALAQLSTLLPYNPL